MADTPLITLMGTMLDGGIGRNLLNLSKGFVHQGCRVDMVLNDLSGPYVEQLDPTVRLLRIPTDHAVSGVPWLLYYFYRSRPAYVLTPNVRLTLLACRAGRLARPKPRIFVNVHSTYSIRFQQLDARKRNKRLRKLLRVYPSCCDGIICVSQGVADDFAQYTGLSGERLTVMHNPVDRNFLLKMAQMPLTHDWFGPGQPPVIVSVGRIMPSKNVQLLIEAFTLLRKGLEARLAIIGDGPDSEPCRRMAALSPYAADIAFLGHQSNPWQYMARSAVFVLSSNVEGFGNVLIEAMAVGTPVVSTDCPHGPKEILQGGKYGVLVPMEDAEGLAGAIRQTLTQADRPKALLSEAVERFELDRVAKDYLRVFAGRSERDL